MEVYFNMEGLTETPSASRTMADQSQTETDSEYSAITHKPAISGDPDCVQNCVYAQILRNDCTRHEKDGNQRDDACLCRNINAFIHGGPYQNCFAVCGGNAIVMKEVILDVCKAVVPHPSKSEATTTISTMLPWGFAPWSFTTNGVFSIGYPDTKASATISSTTTLEPGDRGYTTTLTNPIFPVVTEVVGISVSVEITSSKPTSRSNVVTIPLTIGRTDYSANSTSPTSTISIPTSSNPASSTLTSSTPTPSIPTSSIEFIPVPTSNSTAHGLATGAIIGVAVTVPLLAIGFFLAFMVWFIRRQDRKKDGFEFPAVRDAAQIGHKGSGMNNMSSSADSKNVHPEVGGIPINELGGIHVGAPRFELDSTPMMPSHQPHMSRPQSSEYTYIPYRRPDDESVLSTRYSETQLPNANNQVIDHGHLGSEKT